MFVQTVALKDVKFYAFHGFYPEEQLTGSHFSVDVEVNFIPSVDTEDLKSNSKLRGDQLNSYISYARHSKIARNGC